MAGAGVFNDDARRTAETGFEAALVLERASVREDSPHFLTGAERLFWES